MYLFFKSISVNNKIHKIKYIAPTPEKQKNSIEIISPKPEKDQNTIAKRSTIHLENHAGLTYTYI